MHKKLAEDLTSLAHSILRMKDKDDVFALKVKAHEVYEKLALLAYVEEYVNTTPNAEFTKEELIAKVAEVEIEKNEEVTNIELEQVVLEEKNEPAIEFTDINKVANETEVIETVEEIENIVEDIIKEDIETPIELDVEEEVINMVIEEETAIEFKAVEEVVLEETKEEVEINTADHKIETSEIVEQPFDEIQELLFGDSDLEIEKEVKEEIDEPQEIQVVQNKEEVEKVEESDTSNIPTLEEELGDTISVDVMANLFEKVEPKKTLHDKLQNTIRIDLNDRIAFVKHLFNGSQQDFNRVISQLNTINSEMGAKNFIQKMIKPDYDWSDKEEYELRLMEIIERRFIV